jgi:hypothetical protein
VGSGSAWDFRPWEPGEILSAEVHDIWCRPGPSEPWQMQIMFDEAEGRDWISRRCAQVRRPIDLLGRHSPEGVPYLAPEVQLFYKAHQPRPKDEEDFRAALPALDAGQRQWLATAITRAYGDLPWCDNLRREPRRHPADPDPSRNRGRSLEKRLCPQFRDAHGWVTPRARRSSNEARPYTALLGVFILLHALRRPRSSRAG